MDYLQSAQKSLFRWEALQEYQVDEKEDDLNEWWDFIGETTRRGVKMERVRRIVFPMNDYTKKEIEIHKQSVSHGDDIWYVDTKDVGDEYPACFWLIDDKLVLKMNYGSNGEYLGFDVAEGISSFIQFKERVLKVAQPISCI